MNSDTTRRFDDIANRYDDAPKNVTEPIDDSAALSPRTMMLQLTTVNAIQASDAEDDPQEVGAEPESEDESDRDGEEEGKDDAEDD